MSPELDLHLASPDEIVAAHRNVFDIWSRGLPLEDHLRYRLESPSHRRATWFVGCVNQQVVASLGGYPFSFRVLGETLRGVAIGSVYTLGAFRGHGFAPRLLGWVEEYQRQRDVAFSVLYSDIKPEYYARLGYALCPAWAGWCDPQKVPADPDSNGRLVRFKPEEHLPRLARMYADYHGAMPLSIARDADYWTAMFQRFPRDEYFALQSASDDWAGYLRIAVEGGAWRIRDFALACHGEALAETLYAALIATAHASGISRLGGWLPDTQASRKFFELARRLTEVTMIKPLAWHGTLSPEMIAGTSLFCELDHV